MFTGIIEHLGTVAAVRPVDQGCALAIDLGPLAEGLRIGDSVCCSGACLTVARLAGSVAGFDVSAETLRKTTLGAWRAGRAVNLERALRLGDRLGGHLVGGHVDGIGRLLERRREGGSEWFAFLLPDNVRVVEKGSICVDGVSLTTCDCRGARFAVALIPHTLAVTTLGALRPGDTVNLEQDLVGRWVQSLVSEGPGGAGSQGHGRPQA